MDISIGRLNVCSFCIDNIEHIRFRKELVSDLKFKKYFPYITEDNLLNSVIDDQEIRLMNSYIIKDGDKLIGWIHLGGFNKEASFDLAIHPTFRKKGYAPIIIDEVHNYLFDNDIASTVECVIRENNHGSINCIEKTKYKKIAKMDDFYIYKLYKRDYNESKIR